MRFEEQIMPKDKYPSIFSPQMETIGYYPSNLLRNARSFKNWGDILGYPPVLAGGYSVTLIV